MLVGRGSGFNDMRSIIHDFVDYNERVVSEFTERLNTGLTSVQRRLISIVTEEAVRRGIPVYTVGGLPRDLWLGRRPTDLDLVVEGDAIALGRALAARHGGRLTAHPRFGTARWDFRGTQIGRFGDGPEARTAGRDDHTLDLVTARSETYQHAGALPTVKPGTIEEDTRRRDFSINTLAVRLDGSHFGEVTDNCGALADLQRGQIGVLHERSFLDDPTRMYRAARYEKRFSFEIAGETLDLIPEAAPLIAGLSGQRIRHELDLIMDEEANAAVLSRLSELHLVEAVHRDLPQGKRALQRISRAGQVPGMHIPAWTQREAAWILWVLELHQAEISSIGKRLHLARGVLENMMAAARLFESNKAFENWRPSQWAEFLDEFPEMAVYVVSLAANDHTKAILKKYLLEWKVLHPITRGRDLRDLGVPPGPAYRSTLSQLRNAWIDGLVNDAAGERRLLSEILRRGARRAKRGDRRGASSRKPVGPDRRKD